SGLSTAGGVAFDVQTSINIDVRDLSAFLRKSGYLPDLTGLTVVFVGLGQVAPPQGKLRPAQRRHIAELWTGVAKASGATCVASIAQVGSVDAPDGVPSVRIVPVPPPAELRPSDAFVINTGADVGFLPDSDDFEDRSAAK